MKLRLLATALFILLVAPITCTVPPMPKESGIQDAYQPITKPWMIPESIDPIHEEIDVEPTGITYAEEQTSKEQMIYDIINTWIIYLNDENVPGKDPRWGKLYLYAEALADSIIMYQNQDTDIGGRLPKDRSTHVLIAVIITKESALQANAVGKEPRLEVGLMQCHGRALAGYDPGIVQRNYKLGIMLGVRWLASQVPKCPVYRIPGDKEEWRAEDWIKPLSVYAGGQRAVSKRTGKCYSFDVARERVGLARLYLARIDAAKKARLLL